MIIDKQVSQLIICFCFEQSFEHDLYRHFLISFCLIKFNHFCVYHVLCSSLFYLNCFASHFWYSHFYIQVHLFIHTIWSLIHVYFAVHFLHICCGKIVLSYVAHKCGFTCGTFVFLCIVDLTWDVFRFEILTIFVPQFIHIRSTQNHVHRICRNIIPLKLLQMLTVTM